MPIHFLCRFVDSRNPVTQANQLADVSAEMVKGLFMFRSDCDRYNIRVDAQEDGSGYNISSSSDPTTLTDLIMVKFQELI